MAKHLCGANGISVSSDFSVWCENMTRLVFSLRLHTDSTLYD